jgi:hypothetical protein
VKPTFQGIANEADLMNEYEQAMKKRKRFGRFGKWTNTASDKTRWNRPQRPEPEIAHEQDEPEEPELTPEELAEVDREAAAILGAGRKNPPGESTVTETDGHIENKTINHNQGDQWGATENNEGGPTNTWIDKSGSSQTCSASDTKKSDSQPTMKMLEKALTCTPGVGGSACGSARPGRYARGTSPSDSIGTDTG